MKTIEIYTDGGCVPNPGRGACAFVVVEGGKTNLHEASQVHESTTNNIMELSAVVDALEWAVKNAPGTRIYLNTDSQYVQLGHSKWMAGWKKNGWRN
jgi:ribonuclease HI